MLAAARRPRTLLAMLAALLLAVVPVTEAAARGGSPAGPGADRAGPPGTPPGLAREAAHEVWVLDQGTDLVHILDSREGFGEEVGTIDLGAAALRDGFGHAIGPEPEPGVPDRRIVPHMIDFDSEFRYAFIAATAGGLTIVVDARSKEVVEVLATGPGTHMAVVTPDDSAAWVAVIGSGQMIEIPLRLGDRDPVFEFGRRVDVEEVLTGYVESQGSDWTFPGYRPVCHQFTPDSREAWVTLGPGWQDGGLFVLDLETLEVAAAWDPTEVRANCGVGVNRAGTRVVANWSGAVVEGGDTEGEWYLFNARTKTLLRTESARGLDAHGVRFSPDGRELWAVNRNSGNGLVIDGRSFRVIDEIDEIWDAPDILDFSPGGEVVYVTQRGPAPRSGAVHAATGDTPGLSIVDAASRTAIGLFEPPTMEDTNGDVQNDVHGVGVRPVTAGERLPAPAARALVRRPAVVPVSAPVPGLLSCHLTPG